MCMCHATIVRFIKLGTINCLFQSDFLELRSFSCITYLCAFEYGKYNIKQVQIENPDNKSMSEA